MWVCFILVCLTTRSVGLFSLRLHTYCRALTELAFMYIKGDLIF